MKYFNLLVSILFFHIYSFAQDLQVTNMQGYVVEDPKFTISNNTTFLTFATNMKVYKFPATGPSSPISNPINPDPNQWGPFQVDIASTGDFVYMIFSDYYQGNIVIKVAYSNNRGIDWYQIVVDTINLGNFLPGRLDLPKVIVSEGGKPYFFYYVFENSRDTSGIYLYDLMLNNKRKVDTFFPKARYEYAVTPFVKTINNIDHLYLSYWIDSSFYMIKSTNGGQTFTNPTVIQTVKVLWPAYDWQTTFLYGQDGKLYFKYDYQIFDFPHDFGKKHYVTYSQDGGQTWSTPILIDTNFNSIYLLLAGNKFVKYYTDDDNNLYVQSSDNLISWSNKLKVNSVDSSVITRYPAGAIYDNKIALAWKDKRTGSDEIFYSLLDIPTSVEKNLGPENFVLYQNYPNPFNPKTTISFTLNKKSFASIKVYDVFGKLIRTLVNDELNSGSYNIQFDGSGLSSGVYYYELTTGEAKATKKMILIK